MRIPSEQYLTALEAVAQAADEFVDKNMLETQVKLAKAVRELRAVATEAAYHDDRYTTVMAEALKEATVFGLASAEPLDIFCSSTANGQAYCLIFWRCTCVLYRRAGEEKAAYIGAMPPKKMMRLLGGEDPDRVLLGKGKNETDIGN